MLDIPDEGLDEVLFLLERELQFMDLAFECLPVVIHGDEVELLVEDSVVLGDPVEFRDQEVDFLEFGVILHLKGLRVLLQEGVLVLIHQYIHQIILFYCIIAYIPGSYRLIVLFYFLLKSVITI